MSNSNLKKGLHSIKTMSSARKSTIPVSRNSNFFELFILDKERERLQTERNKISVKLDMINTRLEEIELEIKRLVQKAGLTDAELKTEIEKLQEGNKTWRSLSINY